MQEMSMIIKKYLIKKLYLIITQTKKKVKGKNVKYEVRKLTALL